MTVLERYRAIALTRQKELPVRMALALFVGLAVTVLTRTAWPAVWFAAVVVTQALDWRLFRRVRRDPDHVISPREEWILVAYSSFNTAVYSSITVYSWFAGGDAGKMFAMVQPAGGLLNVALHMYSVPRLLFAAVIPHAAYLLGLPLLGAAISPERDMLTNSMVTAAGCLYALHLKVAVSRTIARENDLKAAGDEAREERARAEQANAAKSAFLATISHEIRTPMNAVVAAATLLDRSPLSGPQRDTVAMLSNASEMLLGLVNDVLDLSKIESGKLDLAPAAVDLEAKIRSGVQLWAPRAQEKGVDLEVEISGLPARAVIDPLRFQQILANLLSNAVKFTDRGAIRVCARGENGRLTLEVSDTGCGLTPEEADRVFLSFEQAGAGASRQRGTGLGLSISRSLAQVMGGTLGVESRRDEGSTFRLDLPLIEAVLAPQVEAEQDGGMARLKGAAILLVEDHLTNQRIVQLLLEPFGCQVTLAEHGREALDLCDRSRFDAILMDMQMPVMGGIEATSALRAGVSLNTDTPVIALTANALAEHRDAWRAIGVEAFVTKPISLDLLVDALIAALGPTPEDTSAWRIKAS
jgi:signal transduction histidine kinase/CheY-like chemotaxis protein